MKIYYSNIASVNGEGLFPPIGVLISFWGLKKLNPPSFCDSLFLDSGAFSASRQAGQISLKDYINFIQQNKDKIDIYCSLDHISSSAWIYDCFLHYPEVKFHGFGIQDRDLLTQFDWYSVDASSVHVMARYGGICSPYGDLKINPNVQSKDLAWCSKMNEDVIRGYVESKGVDYEKARQNDSEGVRYRSLLNILYYEELSQKIVTRPLQMKGFGLSFR